MDLILINPAIPSQAKKDRVPNIGVLCLASFLKKNGKDVIVFDLAQENDERLLKTIREEKPSAIGFSCSSAEGYQESASECERIKSEFRIPVFAGGQHVTGLMTMDKGRLSPLFDCHIAGPGEQCLFDLLQITEAGDPIPQYLFGKPQNDFTSLDYTLYPNHRDFIPCIEVVRGCSYCCNFCNAANMRGYMGYKYRDVEELRREISRIIRLYGEDTDIFLFGPIFGNDISRTRAMLEVLLSFPRTIKYTFNMRVDNPWEQYMDDLAQLTIRSVFFGMESASEKILLNMGKTTNPLAYVKKASSIFKAFYDHQIPFFTAFILGYWGEDKSTIQETRTFLEINCQNIKAMSVNQYYVYPGSADYSNLRRLSTVYQTGYHLDTRNGLVYLEGMGRLKADYIHQICKELEMKYNTDREYYSKVRDWRFF